MTAFNRISIDPPVKIMRLVCILTVCMSGLALGNVLDHMTSMGAEERNQNNSSRRRTNRYSSQSNSRRGSSDVNKTIEELYAEMARNINEGRILSKERLAKCLSALRISPKEINDMSGDERDRYYLLKAWTMYCKGNPDKAQDAAKRVMKMSPENKDGVITHTAISLLEGEEPLSPGLTRRKKQEEQVPPKLELDVDQIRNDVIGHGVSDMELKCLNSTTFSYDAGEENLCVVLWRLPGGNSTGSSEPNGVGSAGASTAATGHSRFEEYNSYGAPGMMGRPIGERQKKKSSLQASMKAFKKIFSAAYGAENMKFLAVNKDDIRTKRAVIGKLLESPWPWAHVMESDPESRAVQFKGIEVKHDQPVMLLVSRGTISYAGPVRGFLAPMMAAKAAGAAENGTAAIPVKKKGSAMSMLKNMMSSADRNKTGSETARRTQAYKPKAKSVPKAEPVELTIAEEIAAQKLLENCKMQINIGRKLGSYRRGVKYCKEAISKYAGTKYAEQARMLLRKVPERHHRKYDITDEDLGL